MSSYDCIVYTPTQAGTYRVTLSVTDGMGKTGSDSIQITVRRIPLGGGEGVVPPEPGGAATESEEGRLPPGTPPPPTAPPGGEDTGRGLRGGVTNGTTEELRG